MTNQRIWQFPSAFYQAANLRGDLLIVIPPQRTLSSSVAKPVSFLCFGSSFEFRIRRRFNRPDYPRRFGFQNASSIDALLDQDDVPLEAILNEDDILQECKAQNTRLIDYFQRLDVLQKLFGYVSGNIQAEGPGNFRCVRTPSQLIPLLTSTPALDIQTSPPKSCAVKYGLSSKPVSTTSTSCSYHSGTAHWTEVQTSPEHRL